MPIDLNTEVPVLLADFAKRLTHQPVTYRTIYGWYDPGVMPKWGRKHGDRIRLETIDLPHGRCTTQEAYERFIEALNTEPEDA